jgi:hypothetical protein
MTVMDSGDSTADGHTPTLRWLFVRKSERVQCELSLDGGSLVYQLRIRHLDPPAAETAEAFRDVSAAFRRQIEFEAALVRDGWSLHQYGAVSSTERP